MICSLYSRVLLAWVAATAVGAAEAPKAHEKVFRGAAAVDITPRDLPVIVSGGMMERTTSTITDRFYARCLVLDDGTEQIALVVIDSCMIPRELLDDAKDRARRRTSIRPEHMLMAATHTHAAPSVMAALGNGENEQYGQWLVGKIAESVEMAYRHLLPAQIGWAVGHEPKNVFCRRFLMKPGTAVTNAFGGKQEDRVQSNPGYANPNVISPTGSIDDSVSVIAVETSDGKPLALLANCAGHYAGAPPLSTDYFGVFCDRIGQLLGGGPTFVGMLSSGASGDTTCHDFLHPPRKFDRFSMAEDVSQAAFAAAKTVHYYRWLPLVMRQRLLTLPVRMPTPKEVTAAEEFQRQHKDQPQRNASEVFARETVLLSKLPPQRELKLQAIRIGPLGIVSIPNEVFGITGLKIKRESPLQPTVNISLANGYEGYLPPLDQHRLGGYETWRNHLNCLEEAAESKVFSAALGLLQDVSTARADEKSIEVKAQ